MEFKIAQRRRAKARIGLTGPSGSGKTWGALLIAAGLGESVGVIDTERGSAELYAGMPGMPEFAALEMAPPYSPERFIEALGTAANAGIATLIIDSVTHEWNGIGGCLEINDAVAQAKFRGNTWSAWNETTPRHRKFLDAILTYPGHVIVTLRSKTETSQEERNGKKVVVKLGMKAEQRDGFEYELTTVLDIVHAGHYALASKDRTGLFMNRDPEAISTDTGRRLRDWLESGAEPAPDPVAEIRRAADVATLQALFATAAAAARASGNRGLFDRLVDAKDERKAELTPAADAHGGHGTLGGDGQDGHGGPDPSPPPADEPQGHDYIDGATA